MDCNCEICKMVKEHELKRKQKLTMPGVRVCNNSEFGKGDKYSCRRLDCPVHGERNIKMFIEDEI